MELVKYDVFQGSSGKWYVNCPKRVAKVENQWFYPARRMNMDLDKFCELLINDFKVDYIDFTSFLYYSWSEEHYALANKFKLWLNKQAREGKWMY